MSRSARCPDSFGGLLSHPSPSSARCRRCDAPLAYTPGDNAAITCRYCGEVQPIAEASAAPARTASSYRELLDAGLAAGPHADVPLLGCTNCGAATTRPGNVISDRCPFCDSPVVARGGARLRTPDGILPFLLDEARAREEVVNWERALWFKPGSLFGGATPTLHAVYLPYWSFDWDVSTAYVGRTSGKGSTEKRGSVRTQIRSSTVLASATVPVAMGADLEPWDIENVTAPRDELLLGVRAETHGEREGLGRGAALSHRLLEREVDHAILREIGDPRADIESRDHTYHAVTFRLMLLPVWITSYRYEGKAYRVLVNGRNGEVVGERPVSRARVAGALAAPFAIPTLAGIVALATSGADPTASLAAFWGCLAVQSVLVLALRGSGDAGGPVRRGQFFLTRTGERGTENFAEIVSGAMQNDAQSRKQVWRGIGFVGLLMSVAPLVGTLLLRAGSLPVGMAVAFNVFGLLVVAGVWFSLRQSAEEKRFLLGVDEARPS